jgi:lysophospholipase L1-like esterase
MEIMKRIACGALLAGALLTCVCLLPLPAAGGNGGFGGGGGGGRGGFGGGAGARGGGGSILDQVRIQGNGTNDKSWVAHQQLLTKAKIGKGKIDVYVEGDSIMRRWGCDAEVEPNYAKSYAVWKDVFWGYNAGDFAWGADTIQNILWRLRNGELDDLNPKVTVFLGGTNNVNPNANVDDLTKGLTACFDEIRKKAPDTTLIIIGILPRQPAGDIPVIDKINENISKLADGKKTRYVDLKDKFYKDGALVRGLLNPSDNLHPEPAGYQIIADALKPILKEVLGPPATEDHAPPPTWDPSANGAPKEYPKKAAAASAPAAGG